MKAYEYRIVSGVKDEVENEVEELTRSGWIIHGNHQILAYNGKIMFSQSMVKPRDEYGTL